MITTSFICLLMMTGQSTAPIRPSLDLWKSHSTQVDLTSLSQARTGRSDIQGRSNSLLEAILDESGRYLISQDYWLDLKLSLGRAYVANTRFNKDIAAGVLGRWKSRGDYAKDAYRTIVKEVFYSRDGSSVVAEVAPRRQGAGAVLAELPFEGDTTGKIYTHFAGATYSMLMGESPSSLLLVRKEGRAGPLPRSSLSNRSDFMLRLPAPRALPEIALVDNGKATQIVFQAKTQPDDLNVWAYNSRNRLAVTSIVRGTAATMALVRFVGPKPHVSPIKIPEPRLIATDPDVALSMSRIVILPSGKRILFSLVGTVVEGRERADCKTYVYDIPTKKWRLFANDVKIRGASASGKWIVLGGDKYTDPAWLYKAR